MASLDFSVSFPLAPMNSKGGARKSRQLTEVHMLATASHDLKDNIQTKTLGNTELGVPISGTASLESG
jgi:hypothetical protein